jgi:GNAT superfamily N-acetyltransferase
MPDDWSKQEWGQYNGTISDLKNAYWASQGYDAIDLGREIVILNPGAVIAATANAEAVGVKSLKHADHDQSEHGSWADDSGVEKEGRERKDPWEGSLITREKAYEVVNEYTGRLYNNINRHLRGTDKGANDADIEEKVDAMDAAFFRAPMSREDRTVYRGVSVNVGRELVAGETFKDEGYTSTTTDMRVTGDFTGYGGGPKYVMEITVPSGTQFIEVEESSEKEIILNRGSRFSVEEIREEGDARIIVATLLTGYQGKSKSIKHGDHDQSEHGNWASGNTGERPNVVQLGQPYPTRAPHASTGYAEPESSVALPNGRSVDIQSGGDAVSGGYNGYFVMHDKETGERMGYLDYQSSGSGDDKRVQIAMVETTEGYRGQGVATALLARLVAEFPETKIEPGSTTEDGGRWWQSVKPLLPASSKSLKHLDGDHDQSDHGSWATGITGGAKLPASEFAAKLVARAAESRGGKSGIEQLDLSNTSSFAEIKSASDTITEAIDKEMGKWPSMYAEPRVEPTEQQKFLKQFSDGADLMRNTLHSANEGEIGRNKDFQFFVATGVDGTTPVGTLVYRNFTRENVGNNPYLTGHEDKWMELTNIGTNGLEPGVGTRLVTQVLGAAAESGRGVWLNDPYDEAARFYKELGFEMKYKQGDWIGYMEPETVQEWWKSYEAAGGK